MKGLSVDYFDPSSLVQKANLQRGLSDQGLEVDSKLVSEAVKRICASYRVMKAKQATVAAPYQPGGEWADYIAERSELYQDLLGNNIDSSARVFANFWRNSLGLIVKEYAPYQMLKDGDPNAVERFTQNVLRNYLIWKDIYGHPDEVLEIPKTGNAWGILINDRLVAPKATRFHAHASAIGELVSGVEHPTIVEIGGGYGGVAHYVLRDNPKARYVDLDLPETLVIAAFYLLTTLPDRKFYLYGEGDVPWDDQSFSGLLLPNFAMPDAPDNLADLLFNSFSLSEVPRLTLEEYLSQVSRITRRFFLHNNMDRKGVFNRGFERIPASEYPIKSEDFRCLYRAFDLFHGHSGDYREYLYEKRSINAT